jgi:hypothetical protein
LVKKRERRIDPMKKGMMVMTILVALSFLISISTVSPLFAKQATQTTPTTKQQTPAQSPQTQTIKPPAGPTKTYEMAKEKFWDLVPTQIIINGVSKPCGTTTFTATPGQTVTLKYYWQVKTPPLNDITEADAKAWGTGKSYSIEDHCNWMGPVGYKLEDIRTLPQFTWAQVKLWKKGGQGNAPKIWTETWQINLTTDNINYKTVTNWSNEHLLTVDSHGEIPEINEGNNGCYFWINKP